VLYWNKLGVTVSSFMLFLHYDWIATHFYYFILLILAWCICYVFLCYNYKDTCKCIFCLGAPACLNVFLFFQANK